MRPFRNRGWEYYDKCVSIMFAYLARGTHAFCPNTAEEPTFHEADEEAELEDDTTIVNPPFGPTIAMAGPSTTTTNNQSVFNCSVAIGSTTMDLTTELAACPSTLSFPIANVVSH
jgi:hypothetical protein